MRVLKKHRLLNYFWPDGSAGVGTVIRRHNIHVP